MWLVHAQSGKFRRRFRFFLADITGVTVPNMQRSVLAGVIHDTPADDGLQHPDVGDVLGRNVEEVPVEDDEVGELTGLYGTGELVLTQARTRSSS